MDGFYFTQHCKPTVKFFHCGERYTILGNRYLDVYQFGTPSLDGISRIIVPKEL